MSVLHRAGLGGLAATLQYIEDAHARRDLKDSELPGPLREDGSYPWNMDRDTITLEFGSPDNAASYLKRLFAIAFQTRRGLIYLPAQHAREPDESVLAELQNAMTLTIIQHGQTRTLAKESRVVSQDVESNGKPIPYEYKPCSWFKHQDGWKPITHGQRLCEKTIEVVGPINPGAMVRHVAFGTRTRVEEPVERILPLYFAIVGCLALAVNRGAGVLLVPDVQDLLTFAKSRPAMTPVTREQCRITNAADAALQAQVRLRSRRIHACNIPAVYAMTFTPTPWASQQKSRVATVLVPVGDDRRLDRFADALACLPPRIIQIVQKTTTGKGKQRKAVEKVTYFWADSVVRPLVAENLALDRPWYSGFARLMSAIDQSSRPVREKVGYEQKGLTAMTETIPWDTDGEGVLVRAVHSAIASNLGRIRQETDGANAHAVSQATKNRWDRFKERLRLSLVGSKTAEQTRNALCVLFASSGSNAELGENWQKLLPLLLRDWQKARDLALLAIASYAGRNREEGN